MTYEEFEKGLNDSLDRYGIYDCYVGAKFLIEDGNDFAGVYFWCDRPTKNFLCVYIRAYIDLKIFSSRINPMWSDPALEKIPMSYMLTDEVVDHFMVTSKEWLKDKGFSDKVTVKQIQRTYLK